MNGTFGRVWVIWGIFTGFLLIPAVAAPKSSSLVFPPISGKTYGDAPFALSATGPSGSTVVFQVVNGPARIDGNQVALTGAGKVKIRASLVGGLSPKPVFVERQFTVAPARLTVRADDQTIFLFEDIPDLTVSYSGFVGTDGPENLELAPRASTKTKTSSLVGSYPITLSKGKSQNYVMVTVGGTLTVLQRSYSSGTGGTLYIGGVTIHDNGGSIVEGTVTLVSAPNQLVSEGQDAVFYIPVLIIDTPSYTYRWQRSTDQGVTWADLSDDDTYLGTQTSVLTVRNVDFSMNGHRFHCRVYRQDSSGLTSSLLLSPGTLTVLVP